MPERVDVLLLFAEAHLKAGKGKEIRKRLQKAVELQPDFWLAHLLLARVALSEDAYDDALASAQTVLDQRPSYVAPMLIKSQALYGQGEIKTALATLDGATRIAPLAPSVLLARADLTARLAVLTAQQDQGKPGEEPGAGDAPGAAATDAPEAPKINKAQMERALSLYRKVLELHPEHVHGFYGLGWALERFAKYSEAEDAYREVLALQPRSVHAVNSIGYALLKQGRVGEAQEQFRRALDMDKEFVTAKLNLGATLDLQGKYGDAIKVYERVLKMRGHKENLRALVNCAFDYEAQGNFNKAAKMLLKAHRVAPNDVNVIVWLADNYYFQKKWPKASKTYRQALALDGEHFFAWRGLGFSCAEAEQWDDAISALEKAYSIDKKALELLILMGDIFLQQRRTEEAYAKFKAYVDAGGDEPAVLDIVEELAEELGK